MLGNVGRWGRLAGQPALRGPVRPEQIACQQLGGAPCPASRMSGRSGRSSHAPAAL